MPIRTLPPALGALLSGALLPLAFAPFGQSWLVAPLLAVLFHGWSTAGRPLAAARLGFLFGLGQFGCGVWWVFVSMDRYSGAGPVVAGLLTALFVVVLALFPALAGAMGAWLAEPGEFRRRVLLLWPTVWVAAEWLRGWLFTGFPWLQVGYSQIDTPLAGYAPVFGVLGVGWVAALTAAVLLAVFRHRDGVGPWVAVVVLLWLIGAGLTQVRWSRPAGPPLQAALLQGNVPQELKWRPETRRRIIATYLEMTRRRWGVDVIVWPETAIPLFYHQVRDVLLGPLEREARSRSSDLLIGIPVQEPDGRYYNALISLGRTPGVYYKRHLVPFGEYLPLRRWLGSALDLLQIPMSDFSAGSGDQPPLQAAGYSLAPTICYEDAFARDALRGLPEAAYMVNVSNDAWFGDTIAPHQHLQMARMRALEANRYLLRATNTGLTAVIGPDGRIVAQAAPFVRTSLTEEFVPLRGATPYVRWLDWPVILMVTGLLGWFAVAGRGRS